MQKLIIPLVAIFLIFGSADAASAAYYVAGTSAQLASRQISLVNDPRVRLLKARLQYYGSPLATYAQDFINASDEYGLDWRLVPAIAGVESTFGKNIPSNSYNAYGWANGYFSFKSWTDSIEVVSSSLRLKYIDKGAVSINQIARRYAPPSTHWAWKVKYFMGRINPDPLTYTI